jgi:predicted O-methyltransferase YrrM
MKKRLPSVFPQHDYFRLPYLPVQWEILHTALALGVFDNLERPLDVATISNLLGTDLRNTEILLNGLAALGYLHKKNDTFCNTRQTETFLTRQKETSLVETLLASSDWAMPVLQGRMLQLVRQGAPAIRAAADEEIWAAAARKAINFSRCGMAQQIAKLLSELPDFHGWQKILDLGAGPGLIGIAVTASHPCLTCYLFDRPSVIAVAREVIAEYGMQTRIKTLSGDYFSDGLGDGYQAIIASYVLNVCFDQKTLVEVLKKCHDSLTPGGCLVVFYDSINEEKTSPAQAVVGYLTTALQGSDYSVSATALDGAMHAAGFASVRSRVLPEDACVMHRSMVMHIARKEK